MISLFIDTSTTNAIVALYKDISPIEIIKEENMQDISSHIMPMIDKLLTNNNVMINQINKIFVVNGPGSFTGLRIGVTIAKTMSWSLNIPVVPISSLEVLASTSFEGNYIIPYIDARRDYVFAGIYNKELDSVVNDQYIHINSLLSYLISDKIYKFVGFKEMGFDNTITPNIDLDRIISKHLNDEGVNPHSLVPNYLKKTEAEEKLNKND